MITARTPLRVSLFGGGSDIPLFYKEHGGAVLVCNGDTLTTVDMEAFVSVAQANNHPIAELYAKRFGREERYHTGFTLYTAAALDELAADDEMDLVRWQRWRAKKVSLLGQYLDLGDPRQYKRAQNLFPIWEPLS